MIEDARAHRLFIFVETLEPSSFVLTHRQPSAPADVPDEKTGAGLKVRVRLIGGG